TKPDAASANPPSPRPPQSCAFGKQSPPQIPPLHTYVQVSTFVAARPSASHFNLSWSRQNTAPGLCWAHSATIAAQVPAACPGRRPLSCVTRLSRIARLIRNPGGSVADECLRLGVTDAGPLSERSAHRPIGGDGGPARIILTRRVRCCGVFTGSVRDRHVCDN